MSREYLKKANEISKSAPAENTVNPEIAKIQKEAKKRTRQTIENLSLPFLLVMAKFGNLKILYNSNERKEEVIEEILVTILKIKTTLQEHLDSDKNRGKHSQYFEMILDGCKDIEEKIKIIQTEISKDDYIRIIREIMEYQKGAEKIYEKIKSLD